MLREWYKDDSKPNQWLETINVAATRCTDLTRQLLVFSRRQSSKTEVIDLNKQLKQMDKLVQRSITPAIKVHTNFDARLWRINADPGEFMDVMLNLVINSRDAMPHGGTLTIETQNACLDEQHLSFKSDIKPGDYVKVVVCDTGMGMNEETLSHIFEPFFTTKPEGKGTGLGLAMVFGFVERNHGHLNVNSEEGIGTSIEMLLPRAVEPDGVGEELSKPLDEIPKGQETILVVDDELDLLDMAEHYLVALGYHVLKAHSAAQALELLSKDIQIDLLFSDVIMPGGVNGYQLAEEASQLKPGLKILLTSGYAADAKPENSNGIFAAELLQKPYRKYELARFVRSLLDKGE